MITTQSLDDSILSKQSNSAIKWIKFFKIKVLALIWQLDNTINKCYNDKMLKKATMQIKT